MNISQTAAHAGQRPWLAPVAVTCLVALLSTSIVLGASQHEQAALTWMSATTQALLLATVATSWNVVAGYLGYIDLGHVAYFGLGAYGAGTAAAMLGWAFPAALVAGTALAAATAAVAGTAILHLRGASFAIAALGLLVAISVIVRVSSPFTGGGRGLVLPPLHPAALYYAAFALLVVAVMLSWYLRRTSLWPVLLAVREDEQAAAARGVPTMARKRTVFVAAAAVTGAAGALWAYQSTFIYPDLAFTDARSLDIVTAVLLGGLGTVTGPVIGATVLFAGRALLWLPSDAGQMLLQGLVLIAIVRWMPRGIVGALTRDRTVEGLLIELRDRPPAPEPAASASEEPDRMYQSPDPTLDESGSRTAASSNREKVLLEVHGLRSSRNGAPALEGIDLTVRSGEILGVIGPNSSGKTTLADCICRLCPLDAGTIKVAERDISHYSPQRVARSGIGRTFQAPRVYRQLTAVDNLLLCTRRTLVAAGRPPPESVEQRAQALLTRLGLQEFANTGAGELTAGQQRLLDIGMALMLNPKVLVLDEATAGVTPPVVATIKAVVRSCAEEGRAIMVIEHDVGLVKDLCQRIAVLDHGRLVAEGTPASIIASEAVETAYIGTREE